MIKANDNIAALILTHKRPDKVYTISALKRAGYTGKIILVVDDQDPTLHEYKSRYGDIVHSFSKKDYVGKFDIGDNLTMMNTVIYARNAAWDIAEHLGLDYFLELDDDYTQFQHRILNGSFTYEQVRNLDAVIQSCIEYYKSFDCAALAFAQGGDFIGGEDGSWNKFHRKAMNAFILSPKRRFEWRGRLNDDVCTYVTHGRLGLIFMTLKHICVIQQTTQANSGGLTDIYLELGTYVKSFYTVMMQPSSVVIAAMGELHQRLHHKIKWRSTVPQIVDESYKK